jgi:antitoxin (DNA-binding transcriptional repressor) of toxin-antitoxin stability system
MTEQNQNEGNSLLGPGRTEEDANIRSTKIRDFSFEWCSLFLAIWNNQWSTKVKPLMQIHSGAAKKSPAKPLPRPDFPLRHRLNVFGLLQAPQCDTMCHMKTITIRELHEATGRWVRRARAGEVYVTERGRLVAKIVPASALPAKPFFANPKFTRTYLAQRKHLRGGTDSTKSIREERDREIQ